MATAVMALALGQLAFATQAEAADADRVAVRADSLITAATADAAGDAALTVDVYLAGRETVALEKFVKAASDPRSDGYGKYLSAQEFRQRYATTDEDLAHVTDWLTGSGLTVTAVPSNRRYVRATGRVAAAERAFGTDLRTSAEHGRAPATAVTVPGALRSVVAGVSGLAERRILTRSFHGDGMPAGASAKGQPNAAAPPGAVRAGRPCSDYFGQKVDPTKPPAYGNNWPYAVCGYTPSQIQSAYGVRQAHASGVDGRGVKVAVVASYLSPSVLADLNTYSGRYGLPAMKPGQFTQVEPAGGYRWGEECGEPSWYTEEAIDVEAVHTIAPGADITLVTAASCDDRDQYEAVNKVVDGHLADIVTNSWGVNDERVNSALFDAYHATMLQAGATGIGVYFATGDTGDNSRITADGKPVTAHPASEPLVTAVGGTSLGIGRNGEYLFETGWVTARSDLRDGAWTPAPPGNFSSGTGGGTSQVFAQPSYQVGVVPDAIATRHGGRGRAVPDIAMVADPATGMVIGYAQTFPDGVRYNESRSGGTSLASPLLAGMMAVADQQAHMHHGFVNPLLYHYANRGDLQDVADTTTRAQVRADYVNRIDDTGGVTYSLRSMQFPQTIATGRGYDDMTGVGSPRTAYFLAPDPDPERTTAR
ncbi:S53 family peptidase [Actinoplanes sp. NPDC089786]|uniref:S53 family peptidase n=1 Tax=Actinoplanes sp. NPDC089786 TaxID=3155185 RepID=UPI003436AF88